MPQVGRPRDISRSLKQFRVVPPSSATLEPAYTPARCPQIIPFGPPLTSLTPCNGVRVTKPVAKTALITYDDMTMVSNE